MIPLETILGFYPKPLCDQTIFRKYLLKEYIQLFILDYLSTSPWLRKITFIGGTSIRLIKGIDRFSEDLDFDCKDLTEDEFVLMTDGILKFLFKNGWPAEIRDRDQKKLKAFRRNIYFPGLLYNLKLTGHQDERFLIKVEAQDQKVTYVSEMVNVKGCGFYFPMRVPPGPVLAAMKVSAMLNRQKGRDFYDVMFLLSQTLPDFDFLMKRNGIPDLEKLKEAIDQLVLTVNLKNKMRDFEHLLFLKANSAKILRVGAFFRDLK
jgi:predicted nucleotidyltransferase component of viral defense system